MQDIVPAGVALALLVIILLVLGLTHAARQQPAASAHASPLVVWTLIGVLCVIFWCAAVAVVAAVWQAVLGG